MQSCIQTCVREKNNQTMLKNFAVSKLQKEHRDLEALMHAIDIAWPNASELNSVHASWSPTAANIAEINIIIWNKLKAGVDKLLHGRQEVRPEFVERQSLKIEDNEGLAIERTALHENAYMTSWGR